MLSLREMLVILYYNNNFMELVTLQFNTAKKLWTFRLEIEANDLEINLKQRTLTCHCSPSHIKLALDEFDAKLIKSQAPQAAS